MQYLRVFSQNFSKLGHNIFFVASQKRREINCNNFIIYFRCNLLINMVNSPSSDFIFWSLTAM